MGNDVSSLVQDGVSQAKQSLDAIKSNFKSAVSDVRNHVKDQFSSLKNEAKDALTKLEDSAINAAKDCVSNATKQVTNIANDTINTVKEKAKQIVDNVVDKVKTKIKEYTDKGEKFIDNIKNSVNKKIDEYANKLNSKIQSSVNSFVDKHFGTTTLPTADGKKEDSDKAKDGSEDKAQQTNQEDKKQQDNANSSTRKPQASSIRDNFAFKGELDVGGHRYGVVECAYSFRQEIDETGKPISRPKGGTITFITPSMSDDDLFFYKWMANKTEVKSGFFRFAVHSYQNKRSYKTVRFKNAYCIELKDYFNDKDSRIMYSTITISAEVITVGELGGAEFNNEWT